MGKSPPGARAAVGKRKPPVTWAGRRWDVFISYSWDDGAEFAVVVQKALVASGLRVFVDRTNSESGERLSDWIKVQLKKSGVLLVIVTPHAQENEWVKLEIDYFAEHRPKAPVVPMFIEPCQPDGEGAGALTTRVREYLGFTLAPRSSPSEKNIALVAAAAGRLRVARRRILIVMSTIMIIAASLAGLIVGRVASVRGAKVNHWSRVLERSTAEARWRVAAQASWELQDLGEPVADDWRKAIDRVLLVPIGRMELAPGDSVLDIVSVEGGPLILTRTASGEVEGFVMGRRIDLGPWGEGIRADGLGGALLLESHGRVVLHDLETGENDEWTVEGQIDDLRLIDGVCQLLLRSDGEAKRVVIAPNFESETTVLAVNFGDREPRAKLEDAKFLGNRSGGAMGLCRFGTGQTRFVVHRWTSEGEVLSPWSHLTDERNVPMMENLRPSRHGQGFVFWYLVDRLPRPLTLTPDASVSLPGSRSFYRLVRYHESAPEVSLEYDASEFSDVIALDGYQAIGVARNDRGVVEWVGLPEATITPPREFVTDGTGAMAAWPVDSPAEAGMKGSRTPLLVTAHGTDRSIRVWSRSGLLQKLHWPDDNSSYPHHPSLWVGEGTWVAVKVNDVLYIWEAIRNNRTLGTKKALLDAMSLEEHSEGQLRDIFRLAMGVSETSKAESSEFTK